tara:strand:+ start:109 stop:645 length:537 start_codon:yes stop_codon:yes gene_type:complete
MKKYFYSIFFILIFGCSNQKTVLICGDHVCINNKEAKQYFEENLTIEVKIINKKSKKDFDLVELNLNKDLNKKKVEIVQKEKISNELRKLSNKEIKEIKSKIKEKKTHKTKTIAKKNNSKKLTKNRKPKSKNILNNTSKISSVSNVCELIDECTIEEISKYLIKIGKKKGFPDITAKN